MKESIIYKLVTGCNKYTAKEKINEDLLQNSNIGLSNTLQKSGVEKLILTSLGNSIATGYSMNSSIKPLFLRNKTLKDTMNYKNIDLELYSFARAQDNNDEHILEWINKNIKQSEINRQVHMDFGHEKTSMEVGNLSKKEVNEYYPINPKNDIGLQDLIKINDSKTANIIVYNGITGSFLDNFTRKGKHLNLYGFKRDLISLEAVLKTIYLMNSNTQVYVCGIPNLLGVNAVEIINNKLKQICKLYPNATYVSSVPSRFIYGKDGQIMFDFHYNKDEYIYLNDNIITAINNNYMINKLFIEFDKRMKMYSDIGQFDDHSITDNNKVVEYIITNLITKYKEILDENKIKELIEYYKERYPHDYFYTPKETTIETLKNTQNSYKLK